MLEAWILGTSKNKPEVSVERSELNLDVCILLRDFLVYPFSYVTLHLILCNGDKVCHHSLMFVTYLRSPYYSAELRHLLTA